LKKPIIIEVFDPKNVFDRKITGTEYNLFSTANVPGKRKYIKKFAQSFINEIVLIKNSSVSHSILKDKISIYNHISIDAVTAVIEKLCKTMADNKSLTLPFSEIIIVASEEFVYPLILPLVSLCRMFTVISETHNIKRNDEMYFKYGCIIRNKTNLEDLPVMDSLMICADNKINCQCINIPVINLTPTEYIRSNIVNIRDVKVIDDKISNIVKQWGGEPGLEFYDLLGITPDRKSNVDISVKTDRIFLLDRSKI